MYFVFFIPYFTGLCPWSFFCDISLAQLLFLCFFSVFCDCCILCILWNKLPAV